jgi:hypothetical protein
MPDRILADVILLVHLLIVAFNVGAVPVIWMGWLKGWRFVRNFYFRTVHLLLIGFVAAESAIGAICPLTTWEDTLRQRSDGSGRYEEGFIAHWVHKLLFFEAEPWVFTAAYLAFFALVLFTLAWVKPSAPRWWKRSGKQQGWH